MVIAEPTDIPPHLAPLITGPVRWGYEYVQPAEPTKSPERAQPPMQRPPQMIPRVQAAGLRQAAILASFGALVVIVLDAALGVYTVGGAKGFSSALVYIVNIAAAVVAFRVAQAWQRSRPGKQAQLPLSSMQRYAIPVLNAIVTLFVPYIVLPVEAIIAWRRIAKGNKGHDLVPDPTDQKRVEADYLEAISAWEQRIVQFEAAEVRRFETADLWYPVLTSDRARVVCLFGGNYLTWASALMTTVGTSLGVGARVIIGDLSRRRTTDVLTGLCEAVGVPVSLALLPEQAASAGFLFDGLSWRDLANLIVEVLHSENADLDASLRERQEDRAITIEVSDQLDPSGPVSIGRLRCAMLVIEGANTRGMEERISEAEYDRLSSLYNDVQREHGGVLERLTRIERALRDFEVLDECRQAGGTDHATLSTPTTQSPTRGRRGSLQVVGIDKRAHDLDSDRLVAMLFQLLSRQVRSGTAQAELLVILGADRIRRTALESLATHALQEHVTVLLFFEHLRQDAVEIVGTGGAAGVFFALGNHREAQEASEFIGSQYTWVESQHTRSNGESLTRTYGTESSESTPLKFGVGGIFQDITRTQGESYSEAFGSTSEYSTGEQRVREALVEPEVLMGLPVTGAIYVETREQGRRIVKSVDCYPHIPYVPRVATQPLPVGP